MLTLLLREIRQKDGLYKQNSLNFAFFNPFLDFVKTGPIYLTLSRGMHMFQTLSFISSMLYKDFFQYTKQRMAEIGLNYGSLFFIIYIGKNPECSPSQLTKRLMVDWGHCQRTLDKLCEDGFIEKNKVGRSYHLTLTSQGQEAFTTIYELFTEWDASHLSQLTEKEQEQLFSLLAKVEWQ